MFWTSVSLPEDICHPSISEYFYLLLACPAYLRSRPFFGGIVWKYLLRLISFRAETAGVGCRSCMFFVLPHPQGEDAAARQSSRGHVSGARRLTGALVRVGLPEPLGAFAGGHR